MFLGSKYHYVQKKPNQFRARLLLHHFLSKSDIIWLANFENFELNDNQKQALIFTRETGAIDNSAYRQLSDNDTLKSSNDLRQLREFGLVDQKGKGRATYYIPSSQLLNTEGSKVNTEGSRVNTELTKNNPDADRFKDYKLPVELKDEIIQLKSKVRDSERVKDIIIKLCSEQELKLSDLAKILKKRENWISRTYVKPLIEADRLEYKSPTMINHPDQAYKLKGRDTDV